MTYRGYSLAGTPRPVPERLAQLGFVARRFAEVTVILPPVCEVPAGPFLMGYDGDDETLLRHLDYTGIPLHVVDLPTFAIATYPLTAAEWSCAEAAGVVHPAFGAKQRKEPAPPEMIATDLYWHAAIAYARWLAEVTGMPWRIPSEAEWEKAARGNDGRMFPWGNTWDDTNIGPLPRRVGTHPSRSSPYGVNDLVGSVWQWTTTAYPSRYPYDPDDGREDREATVKYPEGGRVMRGSPWWQWHPDRPVNPLSYHVGGRQGTNFTCVQDSSADGMRLALG